MTLKASTVTCSFSLGGRGRFRNFFFFLSAYSQGFSPGWHLLASFGHFPVIKICAVTGTEGR